MKISYLVKYLLTRLPLKIYKMFLNFIYFGNNHPIIKYGSIIDPLQIEPIISIILFEFC
jgi:hypothetical protein